MADQAESKEDGGTARPVFHEMSVDQLCRGFRFTADMIQDFELDELYESGEESEDDEMWKLGSEFEKQAKPINLYTPPLIEGLFDLCEDVTEDGGVKKLVLQPGTHVKPPAGSRLCFHYVGFIAETVEKFDSSTKKGGELAIVQNDDCGLLKGLRLGLQSMKLLEVAHIVLQPEYGFGLLGCPPRIPPGCTIIFNVRLMDCVPPERFSDPMYMTRAQLKDLDFIQIYNAAKRVRKAGNTEFNRNNFAKAVRSYRRAIDMLESYWKVNDEQDVQRGDFLTCCYCNLAQSYLQLNKGPQACTACKHALKQNSTMYRDKIFFRFAKAKLMVDSIVDARQLVKKALDAGAKKEDCDNLSGQIDEAEKAAIILDKQLAKLMIKME